MTAPDPSSPLDLEAIKARHGDFTVLWAGPVEAMTTPFTAAGAVTCAAAASADDVPALLAALVAARVDAERMRPVFEQALKVAHTPFGAGVADAVLWLRAAVDTYESQTGGTE
jgi:hypothetical protein